MTSPAHIPSIHSSSLFLKLSRDESKLLSSDYNIRADFHTFCNSIQSEDDQEEVSISQIVSRSWLQLHGKDFSVNGTLLRKFMMIFALGNRHNVMIPDKFIYSDALTEYRCYTRVIKSQIFADRIVWEDVSQCGGVAKHIYAGDAFKTLFRCHDSRPQQTLLDSAIRNPIKFHEVIQNMSPHEINGTYLSEQNIQELRDGITARGLLPVNYHHAVCNLSLQTVASPNTVSSVGGNKMCEKYEDGGHIQFFNPANLRRPLSIDAKDLMIVLFGRNN